MYYPQYYTNLDEARIRKDVQKEGFDPLIITNPQGFMYEEHQHQETKLLIFLKGHMDVTVNGKTYRCIPGDKLIIPGNTRHKAIVGENGCTFFWSEKLV